MTEKEEEKRCECVCVCVSGEGGRGGAVAVRCGLLISLLCTGALYCPSRLQPLWLTGR